MVMFEWSWFRSRRGAAGRLADRRRVRPATSRGVRNLERLEDRTLLSGIELTPDQYDSQHILIQYEPGLTADVGSGQYGFDVGAPMAALPTLRVLKLHSGVTVEQALAFYSEHHAVAYAEPNYRIRASVTPNDPSFGQQYGLNNTGQTGGTADADIDAPSAWDVTVGSHANIVAVIDTGVDYTHQDLVSNIWTNLAEVGGNGFDDDSNGYIDDLFGYDFVDDDGDPRSEAPAQNGARSAISSAGVA